MVWALGFTVFLLGTVATRKTIECLKEIRKRAFPETLGHIEREQSRYKRNYDKRHNVEETPIFEEGDDVVILNYRKLRGKARGLERNVFPKQGYLVIDRLDRINNKVVLREVTGKLFCRKGEVVTFALDQIRHYQGSLTWALGLEEFVVAKEFMDEQREIISSRRKRKIKFPSTPTKKQRQS